MDLPQLYPSPVHVWVGRREPFNRFPDVVAVEFPLTQCLIRSRRGLIPVYIVDSVLVGYYGVVIRLIPFIYRTRCDECT